MFPKIVPPACRSIIFFHKDRLECVSGIPQPLADEGCHPVPAGRQPGLGLSSLWRQGRRWSPWHVLDRRHSQIFREQLLLNQSNKRGQVGGVEGAGIKRVGSKAEGRSITQAITAQDRALPEQEAKQTQEEERERDAKRRKRDLFQFLKGTMKTNPREARSNYCGLSWLTRDVEYPVFFQTSATPSTFKGA